ncbi:hypothetical protein IWX90DRAFT_75165 [Phyllosticta citrichinensis]|uniref:Secreted protein n=1 Tax=Phyllosticta citrichinensis TaxID=1130410 RepID=A0ABR1XGK8_9PEZI
MGCLALRWTLLRCLMYTTAWMCKKYTQREELMRESNVLRSRKLFWTDEKSHSPTTLPYLLPTYPVVPLTHSFIHPSIHPLSTRSLCMPDSLPFFSASPLSLFYMRVPATRHQVCLFLSDRLLLRPSRQPSAVRRPSSSFAFWHLAFARLSAVRFPPAHQPK